MKILTALATIVVLAACGDGSTPVATSRTGPPGPIYEFSGTVLEAPGRGPHLCAAVAESYPPQCHGVAVAGLDWDGLDGVNSAAGTTWAELRVRGTYDGSTFTLTEPARSLEPGVDSPRPDPVSPEPVSPCPEPVDANRSLAELEAIQAEVVAGEVGGVGPVLSAWADTTTGTLTVGVWLVDPAAQAALDHRFGTGTVCLEGVLRPVS